VAYFTDFDFLKQRKRHAFLSHLGLDPMSFLLRVSRTLTS